MVVRWVPVAVSYLGVGLLQSAMRLMVHRAEARNAEHRLARVPPAVPWDFVM
jgi:hypothetical protein